MSFELNAKIINIRIRKQVYKTYNDYQDATMQDVRLNYDLQCVMEFANETLANECVNSIININGKKWDSPVINK